MKSIRFVSFDVVFFLSLLLTSAYAWQRNEAPSDLPAKKSLPDLNLLQSRIHEFWQLLQEGRKQEALQFVDPSNRQDFLKRREPDFLSFKVRDIRFEENADAVLVTVLAARIFPEFPTAVEWPVTERYVFSGGTWYVQIGVADAKGIFASSPAAKTEKPDGAAISKMQEEMGKLEIKPDRLDLGSTPQGQLLKGTLTYCNAGSLPISVKIVESPPEFSFSKIQFNIDPGETGTIQLYVNTQFMDGKFAGDILLRLISGPAETKRTIHYEGTVKAPITFAPYPLLLTRSPQEIKLKNNTSQTIRIREMIPPGNFLAVEWRSGSEQEIAAGGSAVLTVRWDANKIPKDWPGGVIELVFLGMIDGRVGTGIPVQAK